MRCNGSRGFKLNSKRFSVWRLCARFIYFFKLSDKWRCSNGQALKSLKKGFGINRISSSSIKRSDSNFTNSRDHRLATLVIFWVETLRFSLFDKGILVFVLMEFEGWV
ncbi:hypothetical protein CFP56_018917 [Quercus suber]|uniref:Uncharacterized protein n=1 Tax=Quercus suber TaxID=58331 RepID=A0AAW0KK52_QUESU